MVCRGGGKLKKVKISMALKMLKLKRWAIKKLGGYTQGELLLAKQQGVILERSRQARELVKPPTLEVTHYDITRLRARAQVSDIIAIDLSKKDLDRMVRHQLATELISQLEPKLDVWQSRHPLYPGSIIFDTELRIASKRSDN